MHSGKLIFTQLMEHLPEKTLALCGARYRGNRKIQSFTCAAKVNSADRKFKPAVQRSPVRVSDLMVNQSPPASGPAR